MDNLTQKTIESINKASELATESNHGLLSTLHLAVVLFEDEEGIAQQAVLKVSSPETLK